MAAKPHALALNDSEDIVDVRIIYSNVSDVTHLLNYFKTLIQLKKLQKIMK